MGRKELDEELDAALKATFPASDAIAVGQPTTNEPRRPVDRRPPKIDKALVNKLAAKVAERRSRSR